MTLGWAAGLWMAAFLCLCQPWRPGALLPSDRLTALTRAAGASAGHHAFAPLLALLLGLALAGCAWAAPGLMLGRTRTLFRAWPRALIGLVALAPGAALLALPPETALVTLCNLGWIRLPLCALAGLIALLATLGSRRAT